MERKNISYTKGITRSPSDMLCQDGDLAECINIEIRNEELIPMEMPVKLGFSLNSGERLVHIHNIKSGPKNYITHTSGVLKAFKVENGVKNPYSLSVSCGEITSIQSIGNTIIAYTATQPYYLIFKDDEYTFLGSKLPALGLSFNLDGKIVVSEIFDVDVPSKSDGDDDTADNPDLSTEENQENATKQIIPEVNKFISKVSESEGKFIFPFFVRYAYRLFDGTYTMHSSPVLMMPSTTQSPLCGYLARQVDRPPFRTFVAAVASTLVIRRDNTYNLSEWSDIISEVSIFISSPIRTYNQQGNIESWSYTTKQTPSTRSYFYGSLNSEGYKKYNIDSALSGAKYDDTNYISSHNLWDLPVKDSGDIAKSISECSLFYKYISFSPDYIDSNAFITVNPENAFINPISNVETGETLTDDYMTHDVLIPKSSFVYNSRLHISNLKRTLFSGYSAASISQVGIHSDHTGNFVVYTHVHTNDGNVIVKSPTSYGFELYGIYLFYPDSDAYMMTIHDTYNNRYTNVPLTGHSLLNGAFYFGGFSDLQFTSGSPEISASSDASEYMPNKLFTSEVNNPFHFPLEGIYTVGNGEIIGMVAVTRPISQGQFGEYPLMMFCSDGNYAMKVDSEGFYERISPVQEDIVLGNDKFSSLENSIAVITKKGIMITTGGEMNRIDSNMDGSHFDVSSLPGIGELMEHHNSILNYSSDSESFLSYVYGARMSYDYSSNRLLIYNPNKTYAYFYYFDNGTLSKITFEGDVIVTSVSDYPDNIVQTSSGSLYSLYEKRDINTLDNTIYGVAVTRPLKLDNPLAYKALYGLKNLGRFGKDSTVAYRLYGSMDGNDYFPVPSLRRRSYLFYRLVLYVNLKPKEAVSGTIIDFDYRMSHKFR